MKNIKNIEEFMNKLYVTLAEGLLLDISDIIYSKDYAIMEIEDYASKLNKIKKLLEDAGYSKE